MRSRFLRLNGVVNMHLFFYFFIFILQMSQISVYITVHCSQHILISIRFTSSTRHFKLKCLYQHMKVSGRVLGVSPLSTMSSIRFWFFISLYNLFTIFLHIVQGKCTCVGNVSLLNIAPGFVNYKKECTQLATASDKVYQLLARGRWFSPGPPASSTTKTGLHD